MTDRTSHVNFPAMKSLFFYLSFGVLFSHSVLAHGLDPVVPNEKETSAFQAYLQKSGLLWKEHKIKALKPGKAFQIYPHACRDGDDLYILSFDGGIELMMPKGQSLVEFYKSGTGGAWSPVFKHDSKTGYFQFLGGAVHRWAGHLIDGSLGQCPDVEVSVHGSFCKKAGVDDCRGRLKFEQDSGYSLVLPN